MDCDDGIACTDDSCGMDGLCAHAPANMRCNDNRFCNGTEVCDQFRGCMPGTAPSCDDMNPNTGDRCDEATNACRNDPTDNDGDGDPSVAAGGMDCDDNDPTISSLAREVCNMRDDNCNGMIDEGALNACGNCDPNCRMSSTGGMGGMPFSDPGRNGVELDPMAGGLVVRANARMDDYLWIPNTGESTVAKWDAVMGVELARYRVGLAAGECRGSCCYTAGCNMISRTVVDGIGDAYVAARAFSMQGSVSKIAADRRDCVDRNGNGVIDTSTGRNDVRPYGQDECVLWTSNVGPVNAVLRSIAIDRGDAMNPAGYPWVGACVTTGGLNGDRGLWKLNPRTGATLVSLPNFVACAYGGVVTADGTLWEHTLSNGITPVNTTTNAIGVYRRTGTGVAGADGGSYGISADARGRVWVSRPGSFPAGYDPAMNTWTRLPVTGGSLGITVDGNNRMWVANGTQLVSWNPDMFVPNGVMPMAAVTTYNTTSIVGGVSAIGADRRGNIWVTSSGGGLGTTPLSRYNPLTNTTTNYPNALSMVYTYTDFTGSVRRTVIGIGTYTQEYDTGCANPTLAEFSWDAVTPAGTSLNFALQTADTAMGLGAAIATPLARAPGDMSPVDAAARLRMAMPPVTPRRFARVTVTFNTNPNPVASPVLRGMSLAWRCPYNVPGG
jgi:hypothetical protein